MFSPSNRLLLPKFIEDCFESGYIAIVPALSGDATPKAIELWEKMTPRSYKGFIIDRSYPKVNKEIANVDGVSTILDLDERILDFKNQFRSKARYLYYNYCAQIIRRSLRQNHSFKVVKSLRQKIGKPVWATMGRYLPKNMLRALENELRHEYDRFLTPESKDSSDSGGKNDNALTLAVSSHLYASEEGDLEDDDDADDDDDKEEENTEG